MPRAANIAGVPLDQRSVSLGIAALLVVGWAASVDTDPWRIVPGAVLGWSLLALGWIDWHTLRLPDALTLPLMGLGLAAAWWDSEAALYASVVGALVGYTVLVIVGMGYRLARGRDGLGRGDAKLLAAGGAWLGWAAAAYRLGVAFGGVLSGLCCLAVLHRARGMQLDTRDRPALRSAARVGHLLDHLATSTAFHLADCTDCIRLKACVGGASPRNVSTTAREAGTVHQCIASVSRYA